MRDPRPPAEPERAAYLDAVSSPRLDPRVRDAMTPFVGVEPTSPSALHAWAVLPAETLERARADVAALLGSADPDTVLFTSSATESRNLAVKGLALASRQPGATIVTSAIEHPAVRAAARSLERDGFRLLELSVDSDGRLDPGAVANAVTHDTALVSIHHGHEDVGVVQDLSAIVGAARSSARDVPIHVDAGASAGLIPLDAEELGCDAVSIGGPPLGAPPWCGALYVRPGAGLRPQIEGGTQELGKRAGPEAMPAIAALGAAAAIARSEGRERSARLSRLAGELASRLREVSGVLLNGPAEGRVPGNVHVSVRGVDGETLAASLATRGVAVAPGSACTQDAGKESPVLVALGRGEEWTRSSVLLSLDAHASTDEVDVAARAFTLEVRRLRALAPDRAATGR